MPEHYISTEDVVGILEDAVERMREEGSIEFDVAAYRITDALIDIRKLPEPYRQASGPEVEPQSPNFTHHLSEMVRLADGEGGWHNGVLARKLRTYEGHPYLVILHDLGEFDG